MKKFTLWLKPIKASLTIKPPSTGFAILSLLLFLTSSAFAVDEPYVTIKKLPGSFTLSASGKSTTLFISDQDFEGVMMAAKNLQTDIKKVTGAEPLLSTDNVTGREVVIIGTFGKSPLIEKLIQAKKLNAADLSGKKELFISQVIKNPMPGVESALVIAGSDKRGTIYGIYDLSAQIGVSPWYYWADVPVLHKNALYVLPGRHTDGEPAVEYRGIFINDEAPGFSGWAKEKFAALNKKPSAINGKIMDNGVNHYLYEHMFDLLLRLKANFLWPAMWNNAFNDDDPDNPILADKMGIIMGTSHHEPMTRAQKDWERYKQNFPKEQQVWNYATNQDVLKEFWLKGMQRNNGKEVLVTVGMRGDGDEPMAQGGAAANISLLEKIIKEQRESIATATGKPANQTPQVWALYKEVQDYYDAGMRAPEDVTILYCDDNWGNVRRLPKLGEKNKGGYGIYYHFDYVGGPRNYKWLNTNPLPHVWEQMNLAYNYGVTKQWVVNVGDLKPCEFPISFFLSMAWNPKKYPANSLQEFTRNWAAQQFGPQYAAEIGQIISEYSKYNGRRKPEMVDPNGIRTSTPYSLTDYREFETVVADYNKLKEQTVKLSKKIPAIYKDAFYQLVLHPVIASANFNEMYLASAKQKWYGNQGRTAADDEAKKAEKLFAIDAQISKYYNDTLANGKWSHMMDQTHIGYNNWQQPPVNKLPTFVKITPAETAEMGVSVEGSADYWPKATTEAVLPELTQYPRVGRYFEVFNRGLTSFTYTAKSAKPWVQITPASGKIDKQQRVWVNVDWTTAPKGINRVPITITSNDGKTVVVQAIVNNSKPIPTSGFVESNGYASMEAIHYSKLVNGTDVKWNILPDYGRTLSGIEGTPITHPRIENPGGNTPHIQYEVNVADTGKVKLLVYTAPSIDFTHEKGLWYAISIDDEKPVKVNIDPLIADPRRAQGVMEGNSANQIKVLSSDHYISKPGKHIIKYWMVDPSVVLEKIVLDRGGVKASYLGPPESYRVTATASKK
ncbi:MAG: glycosyl hydrolase [Sphingobacteriaceae bacterium]|nr:MAG: glycosyl hydrolase [Sphingobacteriaceae bacterium]